MILINMLITIVTNMFQLVKEDVTRQANDFEILELMIVRVSYIFGHSQQTKAHCITAGKNIH